MLGKHPTSKQIWSCSSLYVYPASTRGDLRPDIPAPAEPQKATYQQIPQHLGSVAAHQPRLLNAKSRKSPGRKRNSLLALRVRPERTFVPRGRDSRN
ncbi:LOC100363289 [Phodopus roborovskii]|uniref:LOC100363289 protein n=1 Tax=Phodopus roborovskii TaxID=109678 RepID=A0AAU9YT15_PHORO|nr:LOC100363289 [Phodopus roborovskii]